MSAQPEVFTTSEVAAKFRVGQRTVYRWIEKNRLEAFQTPGGHWRVKGESVMRLFQSMMSHERPR